MIKDQFSLFTNSSRILQQVSLVSVISFRFARFARVARFVSLRSFRSSRAFRRFASYRFGGYLSFQSLRFVVAGFLTCR